MDGRSQAYIEVLLLRGVTWRATMGWREQLAIIVRRFGYWVGHSRGEGDDVEDDEEAAS